ncbi:hypothetical protein E2562_014690 [Oryza meyeriana var. granulata]|uniref:F-box domain-containing protein n=1 Tax=Oryza meyeriana var. granulata TaxID=110450 RepID=A0A6G1D3Y5_9ORYZ|nr:hypothetical protein E2562_014690 [Oryza meyeriana var. granulata]
MVPPPPPLLKRRRVNGGENGSNDYPLVATANDGVLPVDLLHDVLLRLPARPACCFCAVCRPWRVLLSDPRFVAAHAARHPDPHLAVAACDRFDAGGIELVDVYVVDVSGDVAKRVCAGRCEPDEVSSTHDGLTLLVGNDRRFRVLDAASGVVSLVCSVLAIGGNGGRRARWREAPSPLHAVGKRRRHVAVGDGVAYFMLPYVYLMRMVWIVAFDLEAEQWRPGPVVGSPPAAWRLTEDSRERVRVTLAELRGSLVAAYDDHPAATLDLWFRSGDGKIGKQWSKRYAITMPYHGRPWRWDGESAEPVVVLGDGRIVFWVWAGGGSRYSGGVVRVYDPSTSGNTDVVAAARCGHVGVYTGNLLSLVK